MGLGGQLTDWREPFADLFVEEGFQVMRFDNRDAGLSTSDTWHPPSQTKSIAAMVARRPLKNVGYTIEDLADDAAGLLEALEIESAHLVGVSMGGMIAQELAIKHPSRVRSLCSIMSNTGDRKNGGIAASLVAKAGRRPDPKLETAVEDAMQVWSLIAGPHFDADDARAQTERNIARSYNPAGVARQTAAISGTRDRTALLASVTAPTLVIHGLLDPLVKPSGGVATARAVPNARLLAFPDMAHDMPKPRWPELRDAIVANTRRSKHPISAN
jgi:pimeloyl-ACP methyl ester carboxylesterase